MLDHHENLSVLHRKFYRYHSVCFKAIPQGIIDLLPIYENHRKVGLNFLAVFKTIVSGVGF